MYLTNAIAAEIITDFVFQCGFQGDLTFMEKYFPEDMDLKQYENLEIRGWSKAILSDAMQKAVILLKNIAEEPRDVDSLTDFERAVNKLNLEKKRKNVIRD